MVGEICSIIYSNDCLEYDYMFWQKSQYESFLNSMDHPTKPPSPYAVLETKPNLRMAIHSEKHKK